MFHPNQQFFLVLRDKSGVLHEEELDFNGLIHDVAFAGVSGGRLANDGRWEPVAIEPEWSGETFDRVTVSVAGLSRVYSRDAFHDRAVEILCSKDIFSEGATGQDRVSWNVERRMMNPTPPVRRTRTSVRYRPYPFVRHVHEVRQSEDTIGIADQIDVRVSSDLIAELREVSSHSLDRERADFLVGQLVQQRDGRTAVELSSRIPAGADVGSSLIHFSFSPQTFQIAQRELDRRLDGGVILGWHHNHPPPCGHQCLLTVPACSTDNVAFSIDDRIVHRSAFSHPYMVGLVSGKGSEKRADDPVLRVYGWQRGRICELPWSVI